MTIVIKAAGEGSPLFNALAIGLSVQILSGRLDAFQNTPAYKSLLDEFEKRYPQFKPKTWKTLKDWLLYYNSVRDLELLLAPVLFQLNQQHQQNLDADILDELAQLVLNHKASIESKAQWFELEMVGRLCPKLDNLQLKHREQLLVDLNTLLLGKAVKTDLESIKNFLLKNAQEQLKALKELIKSDENAFQRSYSIRDLSALTEALSLNLTDRSSKASTEKRVEIVVENNQQHWSVKFDDNTAHHLFDRSPQRLKLTPVQLQQEVYTVSAPTTEQLQEASKAAVCLERRIIDNPGLGNCGFYAFAIGLISIIQEEVSSKKRGMFDRWVELDPSIAGLFVKIVNSDLDNVDRELLDQLQSSLRIIAYQYQVLELKKTCSLYSNNPKALEENSNYIHFAALYYGNELDTDSRFNPFANSGPILQELATIDRTTVRENHEDDVLMPLFLKLLYGDKVNPKQIKSDTEPMLNSPILVGMNNITQDFFWGTHTDLDYLAIAFKLNLHVLRNQTSVQEYPGDLPNQHTITLQNLGNAHWTTEVMVAKELLALDTVLGRSMVALTPVSSAPEKPSSNAGSQVDRDTPPVTPQQSDATKPDSKNLPHEELSNEQKKLEKLKQLVANSTYEYTEYNKSVWYSFFHRHGSAGRDRANKFNLEFAKTTNLAEATTKLLTYLGDNSNGNTHPHSYRTMLLYGLQGDIADRKSLQSLSKGYADALMTLRTVMREELTEANQPRV